MLTRCEGQRIKITTPDGFVIWVTLLEIRTRRRAVLGVEADRRVIVDREEVARGKDAQDGR